MQKLQEHKQSVKSIILLAMSKRKKRLRKLSSNELKFLTELLYFYYNLKNGGILFKRLQQLFSKKWYLKTVKIFLNKNISLLSNLIVDV